MSRNSMNGAVLYSAETNWGEDSTTFSTRLPVLDRVDLSGLTQGKIEPGRVVQYRNEGVQKINGPQSGTFTIKVHLPGHGSTTSGSVSATSIPTLLGYAIGALQSSPASGTTATGGTATVPTTTASGTFAAGQLVRIGSGGLSADSRGGGQFAVVSGHATTNLTLLTAIGASPNNADVIYGAETVYTVEAASNGSITGLRFLLQTNNLQVECHGCYASAVSYSGLNAGEVPTAEITFTVSWWRFISTTFPTATSVESFVPAPNGAGSFFFNAKGTATRATLNVRSFSIEHTLGVAPLTGVNGVSQYQTIVGCVRTPDTIIVRVMVDADTATASPTFAGYWDGSTDYHLLATMNPTAGAAMGLYFGNLKATGNKPTQMDNGGVNAVQLEFQAHATLTTTTELTNSALRWGFA